MSSVVGKVSAIAKKRKVQIKENELKQELVDLELLSSSDLYAKYIRTQGLALDIAARPEDQRVFVNNVADAVTYYDNYMASLTEVEQTLLEMKGIASQYFSNSTLNTDQKTQLKNQYDALITRLNNINDNTYFNDQKLYGNGTIHSVVYNPKGDKVNYNRKIIKSYNSGSAPDTPTNYIFTSYRGSGVDTGDYIILPTFETTIYDANGQVTMSGDVVQNDIDKLKAEVAKVTGLYNQLVSLKSSLEDQMSSTQDRIDSFKQKRMEEIGRALDDCTRAIESINAIYSL